MEIYEKRGRWCVQDDNGKLRKFATEEAARIFAGESETETETETEECDICECDPCECEEEHEW